MKRSDQLFCTLISARPGGFPTGHRVHPGMLEIASRLLKKEEGTTLIDSFVFRCGDAASFLLTHRGIDGIDTCISHVLDACRQYLGTIRIEPPPGDPRISSCRLAFHERKQEDIIVLLADLPSVDLFNLHLYRIFGDPFSTTRLVSDERLREGFVFTTDERGRQGSYSLPEDVYTLLSSIRLPQDSRVVAVSRRDGEPAAAVSMPAHTGAPAVLLRAGEIFPTSGEIVEPFSIPYLVRSDGERPMMPLIPVSLCDAQGSRSGGPPRVVCLGFSVADGRLIGPADIFDDPALDPARRLGSEMAGFVRAHGPFDPGS
ncbi:MAG: fructose 1,6-bisphosphatase [Methanocalculus sp. MSAO_Arc2]|uniref:fructose 1,6-bisphosphatase n=1 Tax=Methanocalculus sp. MSAO_Arc2 TaxID=2293855 RepID=UPI000FEE3699|nr:MAG: fructose 1,6-bisphosphatase [Methanocalculus sp. MSAO_Arc2]